ncbi:hypothetical protein Rsub_01745 [Raphidocelis subcapitata]|uniref:Uncharacterized protein n=1 Tax=Raphidocelis subcapitata TaxID=307507 RepID=A0A2V0NMU6_9CHLO|nr:hypothetical protein Rsub_01745 [Raphidocelis subcapitata]|eukprot:GBF88844.1 hypothetical protein Rsub_01745 [Raphidocelis subcapitata]
MVDQGALRLAQGGAVPALAEALQRPVERIATNASAALLGVATVAPDLVADAAGDALVAALRRVNSPAANNAAAAFVIIAHSDPERLIATQPDVLPALSSALRSTAADTAANAADALAACAYECDARGVADAPGALAGLAAVFAGGRDATAAKSALGALFAVADGGADLAARVVGAPGVVPALSRAVLSDDRGTAATASNLIAGAAGAGQEQAGAVATPAVVAALVAAVRLTDGRTVGCAGALARIAMAGPQLALRVAAARGAEAALLAAATGDDVPAAGNATKALLFIAQADVGRAARWISTTPALLPALARLMQSDDAISVNASTRLLAVLAAHDTRLVEELPGLPGEPVLALLAIFGGGDPDAAVAAALLLSSLMGHPAR